MRSICATANVLELLTAGFCHCSTVCLRPLQRLFSCATPTAEALQAIVDLNMDVLEIGCGSGYWARLLRERGVSVLAYDLHPPKRSTAAAASAARATDVLDVSDDELADEDNIFGTAWIDDIKRGDASAAGGDNAKDRALLLCWPYEGSEQRGWDADALEHYTGCGGDTVIYVGDWTGRTRSFQPQGMTSSPAFQTHLQKHFVCETWSNPEKPRISTGKWPMVADELTIWRRKEAADRIGTEDWKPEPVVLNFCQNCHLDEAPYCDNRTQQQFCTLLCREVHVQAQRAKAALGVVGHKRTRDQDDDRGGDESQHPTGLASELAAAVRTRPPTFTFGFT